ncbi:MAG: DinB family protein [Rhodospirillales bacterium]|nr:DinB family protein [Rhodospirillales bacterium]
MIDYFRTLARYNRWANARLYTACAKLPPEEITKSRPAYFGSILGTLNHVLVGDRAWLGRIEGKDYGIRSLNDVLYDSFSGLLGAREAFDDHIVTVVDGLEGHLGDTLSYRNMQGEQHATPMTLVLGHLFNHQTHHRGQVHDMLSQTDMTPPALDLIYYVRE